VRRAALALLLVLATAAPALSDGDHDRVVQALESGYGVRHHGVPLLWLARLFVHDERLEGLKLAIFDGVPAGQGGATRFEEVVQGSLGHGWQPFVSVLSVDEQTVVYARPEGNRLVLLVAARQGDRVLVLQLRPSADALRDWVDAPVQQARRAPGESDPRAHDAAEPSRSAEARRP
jgi:hypothetical protein